MATIEKKSAGRSWIAAMLIIIAMVMTPTAIVTHWAANQVTNTEQFVETLSPLASNPEVQQVVIDEVTGLINENVDIKGVTESLFTGLAQSLNLPADAAKALELVADPVANGIESIIENVVTQAVKSDAFQEAWTKTLTLTQEQAVALLSGDPNSLIKLSNDGTLTLPLKPIIVDIKKALVDQGIGFANAIPEVDRDITIGKVPELALARVIYQVGVGVGTWLPWITAAFFAGGILAANRRPRALLATGVVFTALMGFMAFAFATGRILATTLIESNYSGVVGVLYDTLVSYVMHAVAGLAIVGVIAAITGWAFGVSASAGKFRGFSNTQMDKLRKAIDPKNKVFVKASPILHQYRIVARVVIIAATASVLVFAAPPSAGDVVWAAVIGLVVLFVYEVLQRELPKAVAAQAASSKTPAAPVAPASTAAAKKPAAKKPAAKKVPAKASASSTVTKPAAKKPAAKKAPAKKPVAKKPAAKKS